MRPIDADALESIIQEQVGKCMIKVFNPSVNLILQDIRNAPTIETKPDKGWISVKDRLPPYGERVLVVNEAYEAEQGYTKYNCGVTVREPNLNFTFWGHKVTCWQSLPEPPKGE